MVLDMGAGVEEERGEIGPPATHLADEDVGKQLIEDQRLPRAAAAPPLRTKRDSRHN